MVKTASGQIIVYFLQLYVPREKHESWKAWCCKCSWRKRKL